MGFDKLSFDLGGETVVQRSIRAFAECPLVSEIVLVAGKNRAFLEQQAAACTKPVQVVQGGATRAESAKNGVLAAHGELVAVHDAARPFVSQAVITAALEAAAACGAAAPAVPVKDTVKRAVRGDGKTVPKHCMVADTPDRSTLYAVQTPQCFDRAAYLAALDELDAEKARLADAIGWELAQSPMEIRKRQLDLFAKVSADLANRVSREIYLFETGRKG
jgi:2-C-methyl-D-erythritol 4-phosphate cytidylyltransferase/2-C-methyl-D-erythritol 2,4-cyclodiphosphate synthase